MATRIHSTNGAYTWSRHIKTALGIGLRTPPQLISVSHRYIFWLEYGSASRVASLFLSHCYTCIKTWGEGDILSSTILEKLGVVLEYEWYAIGYIFYVWIYGSCIVIHKSLVSDGSMHYVPCVPYAAFLQIFLLISKIWYFRIQSLAVSKQRDVRWCCFRWSIPLSIDYVRNSCIDMAISTPHAHIAYKIYTDKIILAFFRISYCLHDLIRLNSIVCYVQTTWCTMMWFRWSIPISIDYVWSVHIDRAILTRWCSYCVWNSNIKNHHL